MSDSGTGPTRVDEESHDPEKEFEVDWDGDDDPMNPRSMNKLRKWLIVLTVSSSSLCVYVSYTRGVIRS